MHLAPVHWFFTVNIPEEGMSGITLCVYGNTFQTGHLEVKELRKHNHSNLIFSFWSSPSFLQDAGRRDEGGKDYRTARVYYALCTPYTCPFATSSFASGGATPEADGVATIASTINMAATMYAWI